MAKQIALGVAMVTGVFLLSMLWNQDNSSDAQIEPVPIEAPVEAPVTQERDELKEMHQRFDTLEATLKRLEGFQIKTRDKVESIDENVISSELAIKEIAYELSNLEEVNNKNTDRLIEALKGVGKTATPEPPKPIPDPEPNLPPPPEVTKPEPKKEPGYRSVLSPKWRINGKVWTRSEIIRHLRNHPNHGSFDPEWLESLTLQQLWALHDDDHENKVKDIKPVPIQRPTPKKPEPCPGGI